MLSVLLCAAALPSIRLCAGERAAIVVDPHGKGNFATIQEALDSISPREAGPVLILLRNGVYEEKLFIRRSRVTLVGEDWDSTRIVSAVLREEWNRDHHGSDWGAGVVNIDTGTSDVTMANLTVYNNHGSVYGTNRKHQFAIRGFGTRVVLLHCKVISDGGDALSLWDRTDGMYYHNDCYFEGWVDYVCPRGWCYITNSRFFGHNTPSASIWHDGSYDKSQKFVIENSFFDGVAGFPLGRNHLDAQLYLIHCRFSANMADRPFYRPPSSPREWKWGDRHYFFDCHRDGGDYAWFKDNLREAGGSPDPGQITARWAFDGTWDPEAAMESVLPFAFLANPRPDAEDVRTDRTALSWISGRNADSHRVYFGRTNPPEFRTLQKETSFDPGTLEPNTTYYWRIDEMTGEGIVEGELWRFKTHS